jgi:threonine dehydrogenase-like Zn-dependent dehydrogenase
LKANVQPGATVAVIGAGTMGLVTVAALRKYTEAGDIVVAAKYPEQKELATSLGATTVVDPGEIVRAVRRSTSSFSIGDDLSGGADVTIDAIGSARTIDQAIGMTRPRGRVVLLGMPGTESVDLTALWHRETELVGAYTYGTETMPDGSQERTFKLATDLVGTAKLGRLVSQTYSLSEYDEALDHAVNAGRRGAIKICFDLR